MPERKKIIYSPALRMKKGELEGLRELRPDVAACILPRLIVPPASERKSSSQEELFDLGDECPDVGGVLRKYWSRRNVLIDITYLIEELGADNPSSWLPTLFARARSLDVAAVPCIHLTDLEKIDASAFRRTIDSSAELKLGLCILSGTMADVDLQTRIETALIALGIAMTDCVVIVDFADSDLSDPDLVAPVIQGALEQLQEIGQWQRIIYQGTHYPDKNPAEPNQTVIWPRNEWQAWQLAVRFDPTTAEHFAYGDYAADCAKIKFGDQGGRPIPHLRYTTESNWLVVRAEDTGDQATLMKNVCERVVASAQFSSASFSEADERIYEIAHGGAGKTGSATTWRQWNTTHHITRVVADVAKVRGITINEKLSSPSGTQLELPT
ncbi:beta protein [Bordetella bronchiseptica 00-P-2730]|uniref:beta family protein n=1 Tax=Bordetella bronchiseptica TaxID=518 RepID=UPI000459F155|nr:beta family protein [Bordetella bronchiseptica]KCV33655.1 beta protein [Bordetella bronchiseptica 00-P-2730]